MDTIKHYMEESVASISPQASVLDAAKKLNESNISSLMVEKDGTYLGILTDIDLTRKVLAKELNPKETRVEQIMTQAIITVDSEKSMPSAFIQMRQHNVRHLAVTEKKKIVGVLSMKDFANYFNARMEAQKAKTA